MTPRQIVLAAGHSEPVDRVPVTPYMGNYGAAVAGVPIDDYCTDSTTMANAQIEAQSRVGQDMLVAQSDGYYMAEALGMTTLRRPNTTPAPASWPVDELAQIDALRIPDPRRGGRMPVYLGAVRQLRETAGDELAVRACGTGAFSLAGHIMGPDNFVMALAMLDVEPDEEAERRL
ncbi:MAG: uroporphyrinogen decarboxylase family protein, partial [Spirochaetota bacterium]